jgi:hypothetical protein
MQWGTQVGQASVDDTHDSNAEAKTEQARLGGAVADAEYGPNPKF